MNCTECIHGDTYHVSIEPPYHRIHKETVNGYCVVCGQWCRGGEDGKKPVDFFRDMHNRITAIAGV